MKKMIRIFADCFLVSMFGVLILIGFCSYIRVPKDTSLVENRDLAKFNTFTLNGFITGEYQDNLENAYLDQFIAGGSIKDLMTSKLSFSRLMINNKFFCENNYLNIKSGYYTYNCEPILLSMYNTLDDKTEDYFKEMGSNYSSLHDSVDTYYYYVTTSASYNFKDNNMSIDIIDIFDKYWDGEYHLDYLKIDNLDTYQKYYYSTDHHWNHIGSYQGYKDIMNMFNINDILVPAEEKVFDVDFYGSSARVSSFYDFVEPFSAYRFNLKEHDTFINGEVASYGNEENYFNDIINNDRFENHYAQFYGGDPSELIFDYHQEDKENLLILGNSYSNAVDEMIASHFNKTHVIDYRYYNKTFSDPFIIEDYIEEHDIDKVLFIIEINYMMGSEFDLWGENNAV